MNPLLEDWTAPSSFRPSTRSRPAISRRPSRRRSPRRGQRIDAIAANPAEPTFANTIEAMERAERELDRVAAIFFNLAGADTNPEIEALQRDLSPRLAAHHSDDDDERRSSSRASMRSLQARRAGR